MIRLKRLSPVTLFLLSACVTINVYFPAAAAESAADRLIKEVYGIEKSDQAPQSEPEPEDNETSAIQHSTPLLIVLLENLIPAAQAQQPDINISTPAINKLKSQMTSRHKRLTPYYSSGAVGMDNNGLITIRDAKAIPLKERNAVKKLVNDENRDRNALYTEIAKANGHPEWEGEIRSTFARRWIANAPTGWWYNSGSGWKQK